MAAEPNPSHTQKTPRSKGAPAPGGSVESSGQHDPSRISQQSDGPNGRYELHDPFSETTYRSAHLEEIAAHAARLGAHRFIHVDDTGRRSPVRRSDDGWAMEAPVSDTRLRAHVPIAPAGRRQEHPAVADLLDKVQAMENPGPVPSATQGTALARFDAALGERYLIKRSFLSIGDRAVGATEYRFRGDPSRVAFTESAGQLATGANSPSVALSMVDLAQARGWNTLRVTGHEDFKRLVWLDATARGVKTLGYEPTAADIERLGAERKLRENNHLAPTQTTTATPQGQSATKASARGNGSRKAVLLAIDAVLVAKGVSEPKRAAILAAATEKLAQREREGKLTRVRVYDKTASSRQRATPQVEPTRTRQRSDPVR